MAAKKVQVFSDSELMDDAAAEAEELGQEQPAESAPESAEPAAPSPPAPAEPPAPAAPEQTVPYSRFQEIVGQRNAERQELQQLRERWARLDERQRQSQQAREEAERQAAAQREAAQQPDPAIDPVAYDLWVKERRIDALENQLRQVGQNFNQLSQGYQQDQQRAARDQWIVAHAQQYAEKEPTYFPVVSGFANWRQNFWNELTEGKVPQLGQTLVSGETELIVNIAHQIGVNPAPILHKYGRIIELGMKAYQSEQQQALAPTPNGNGNGAARPNAQAASQAGKILSQVAAGQKVQGLSRAGEAEGGGKSRYAMMTAAEIANVDERTWQRDWANPQLRPEMQRALRRLDGFSEDDEVSYDIRR